MRQSRLICACLAAATLQPSCYFSATALIDHNTPGGPDSCESNRVATLGWVVDLVLVGGALVTVGVTKRWEPAAIVAPVALSGGWGLVQNRVCAGEQKARREQPDRIQELSLPRAEKPAKPTPNGQLGETPPLRPASGDPAAGTLDAVRTAPVPASTPPKSANSGLWVPLGNPNDVSPAEQPALKCSTVPPVACPAQYVCKLAANSAAGICVAQQQ